MVAVLRDRGCVMAELEDSVQRQITTVPPMRTFEKGIVTAVNEATGEVTYLIDDVSHTALTISGFMPSVGQPVSIAVNGNDRLVLPPAGTDPALFGAIQAAEGPNIAPNPLVDAINITGWDASFGVTTWLFDTTIESWATGAGGLTLAWTGTTGQNESGGGGVVGSVKGTATRSGTVYMYSPIVTVLRDSAIKTLGSAWIRSNQAGSDIRYAKIEILWYDSTGVTLEKTSTGPAVYDLNATEWVSVDTSDFGPANPASNKARIKISIVNALVGDVYYVDNGLLMAPTNSTISLLDPEPTLIDTFDRADNTDVSVNSPFTWTERSGDWAVASNQLRLTTSSGGLTGGFNGISTVLPVSYASRENFVMECTAASTTTSCDGWGLMWRYSATNSYYRFWSSVGFSAVYVDKIVAGVTTNMITLTNWLVEPGDVVRVETDDSYHRIYINGVLIHWFSDTALGTNTACGALNATVTTNRWENFTLSPGTATYVRNSTSLEIKSNAAGTTFARTPADLDVSLLPTTRQGEYWVVDCWTKARRTNGDAVPYLVALTIYDANLVFLANEFGGGFGPTNYGWTRMISAFEIRNPAAARIRAQVVFLASAANQEIYVSDFELRKASVVTAPILRTAAEGPRLETWPAPTGPQVRLYKEASVDGGYSQMLHGFVHAGNYGATTDANGYITFDHGLKNGQSPAGVFVQPRSPISGSNIFAIAVVDSVSVDGTARVRCINHLGAAMNAIAVTFYFVTFARI